jgi:diacylglycerol kinase (ATP)
VLILFANPTSGRGKGAKVLSIIEIYLQANNLDFISVSTPSLTQSLILLEKYISKDPYAKVVVVGGDGMVHAAINKIRDNPIGIIPAGTGNDFARALGLELNDPIKTIKKIISAGTELIDLGKVGNEYFAAICSTGFDSIVNERANRLKWPRGKMKYNIAMLLELPRFKPKSYEIVIDGKPIKTQAMLIAIANGLSYGGGMKVCPEAQIQDGLLDIMILAPVSKFEFVRIFPSVFKGLHVNHPAVSILQGRSIQITADAVGYADGERIGDLPLNVWISPNRMKVLR